MIKKQAKTQSGPDSDPGKIRPWGKKRSCPSCGKRYYDLGKDGPICPLCSAPYSDSPRPKSAIRKALTTPEPSRNSAPAKAEAKKTGEKKIGAKAKPSIADDGGKAEDNPT